MKKTTAKKAAKRVTAKLKPGRPQDPASNRMATRITDQEKDHLHALAVLHRRTDSAYIREIIVKHLQENPPPKE